MKRKLVAAIACRNEGTRLYGKPIQNLDVENGITILDNIILCLKSIKVIDSIVLGISEGIENEVYKSIAKKHEVSYVIGDQENVLQRLISCGDLVSGSDIFRITSESPFLYFEPVEVMWKKYKDNNLDALFMDHLVDGIGFEIISLNALKLSNKNGNDIHRSEFCSLYIRENLDQFKVKKIKPPGNLSRKDLRLTVDNPEDLVICRKIYNYFKSQAPKIKVEDIIRYLDDNPELKELVSPYLDIGYSTMYK